MLSVNPGVMRELATGIVRRAAQAMTTELPRRMRDIMTINEENFLQNYRDELPRMAAARPATNPVSLSIRKLLEYCAHSAAGHGLLQKSGIPRKGCAQIVVWPVGPNGTK
jgi:hypothetical protein